MPTYSRHVQIPGRSADEIYNKISEGIDRFLSKSSVGSYDLDRQPAQKTITAKSSLFTASLICTDGSVRLDAKLSLLAAPFRSKLDEGIDKWIAKTFGV